MKVSLNPMQPGRSTLPTSSNRGAVKNRKTITISIVSVIVISLIVGTIGFAIGTRYQTVLSRANGSLDYSKLSEVYAQLSQNFDGDLDNDKLIQGAAAGMVSAAGDPYTTFFNADEAKEFSSDLSGTFEGVGIELGQNSDNQLEVISPIDGSPAKAAGIKAHDVIAAVDGTNSVSWTPEKAVTKIRGKAGTVVKLTIIRDGETKDFEVTRAEISVPSVEYEIKDAIGYLRISRFGDDTASLATKAANAFKSANVKGVILDLRGNGGGYVDAAKSVASLWLKSGQTIVEERRGSQVIETETASGFPTLSGISTVVLIDDGSASASEIVAGALKDNGAATLVGTTSYGKGSVQKLVPLSNGAQLKVTIARWYTPNGQNINGDGIKPDVEVTMTADEYSAGNDTQRTKAVEILNK
ncbi:MAG TPA: S41 family peptidase [Candidatus Nanoperiomorbaceae bacterium]|nr:S41 family peptidase [Candidatus Nanoperiomorbaceae bacterium]